MREQLISFETAKLAKKKGFDIQCIHGFVEDISDGLSKGVSEEFYWELGERPDNNYFENLLNYDQEDVFFYSRPTQSLLQKWLREVHDIFLYVIIDDKRYISYVINQEYYYDIGPWNGNFNTYEEALEKGLKESLKLIE